MFILNTVILTVFRTLTVVFFAVLMFGVIPYSIKLIKEELNIRDAARHRRGSRTKDDYMEKLVAQFRNGRDGIVQHRRVAHG